MEDFQDNQEIPQPAQTPCFSTEQIEGYHRTKRILLLAGIVLSLICWITWCILADTWVLWLAGSTDHRWPALLLTAFVMLGINTLIGLPLDFYGSFILEHRFNLSNQTARSWIVFQVKSWLVGAIIGGGLLAALYAALWYTGPLWGLYVWIGVMLFSIVLAKVFPLVILPIFYPAKPLDSPSLSERLTSLAARANLTISGIFDLALSKDTKKANAMLAGLGSSRRVYLSDTLLDNFSDDQIAVVFAHELGHHIRGHIFKLIGIAAITTSLLVALIWWRLNPYAGGSTNEWTGAVTTFAH
ncbi:MAG: M48 family metalloprotease, partial [Phycisphaerales bacterium]|nr:M48 family metalloprotease [Phycisphaerales bacterium]